MSRFHTNPVTGVSGSCRAKGDTCPFGTLEEHSDSIEAARLAFEAKNESFQKAETITLSEASKIALESNLEWSGKAPAWFNTEFASQEAEFGTKAKIIAVIPSPLGDLAVVWSKDSINKGDVHIEKERGYEINRLTFNNFETGLEVAHLTTGSMNKRSIERSFGTDEWQEFAWAEDSLGSQYGFNNYVKTSDGSYATETKLRTVIGEAKLEAKKTLWAKTHAAQRMVPPDFDMRQLTWGDLVNLNESHAPEDEKKLDSEIATLRKVLRKKMNVVSKWHAEPSVDYISVDDELRGKGMGHALYIFGARMQAKQGRILRASGLQSEFAQKSWAMMKKLGLPIIIVEKQQSYSNKNSEKKDFLALDFRK